MCCNNAFKAEDSIKKDLCQSQVLQHVLLFWSLFVVHRVVFFSHFSVICAFVSFDSVFLGRATCISLHVLLSLLLSLCLPTATPTPIALAIIGDHMLRWPSVLVFLHHHTHRARLSHLVGCSPPATMCRWRSSPSDTQLTQLFVYKHPLFSLWHTVRLPTFWKVRLSHYPDCCWYGRLDADQPPLSPFILNLCHSVYTFWRLVQFFFEDLKCNFAVCAC